jgi:hypothetical protein
MRRHFVKTIVPATADALYSALTDLRSWPQWDEEIAKIDHDGTAPRKGTRFALTPKGGPRTTLVVEEAERSARFTDLALLPLGRMRTTHAFVPHPGGGTEVSITIHAFGPLGMLWDKVIARKQAAGAEKQAHALAAYAIRRESNEANSR